MIVNYLAFMQARLKYFSPLFDAINCFSNRGSSTEIKVKHLSYRGNIGPGFRTRDRERLSTDSKIPARRFCQQLARAIQGGQRRKK